MTLIQQQPLFRAEVASYPSGHPEPGRSVLGTFVSPYAARAMRWLCVQAVFIANGLNPDPDVPWSAGLISIDARSTLDLDLGDAPARLRAWVADEDARHPIVQDLKAGQSFRLDVADWSGRYELTAWPWHSHEPGYGIPWPPSPIGRALVRR
ncbi:hypothetical protein [Streptomyces sp. NBC_00690]|uniref:hypothetical protein n=1 Tax=Streptomyces sp. NBC_00690 TaxID=2975808 RepID=UPI002E2B0988|nr:hypothetical protein [Streptomyces sp. NBC_00690]